MIALEPEAASLYIRKMDIDRVIQQAESETLTIKPGTKYLVVNAGGIAVFLNFLLVPSLTSILFHFYQCKQYLLSQTITCIFGSFKSLFSQVHANSHILFDFHHFMY